MSTDSVSNDRTRVQNKRVERNRLAIAHQLILNIAENS